MGKPRLDDGHTGEVREFLTLMGERAWSAADGGVDTIPGIGKLADGILMPAADFTPLHEGLPPIKPG